MSTAHQLNLTTFDRAIRSTPAEMAAELREILGPRLTAYIGSVRETRAVREWADGVRTPSEATVERLRLAFRVATLLRATESSGVVQAWFQGLNPELDDRSVASLLRTEDPAVIGRDILAAARAFIGSA